MSLKSHKNLKFLENFNPETSARERRKLSRRNYQDNPRKSKSIYDERGYIAATGKDLCDCLDETCPGCHFPCLRCSSMKCGLECRYGDITILHMKLSITCRVPHYNAESDALCGNFDTPQDAL